MSAIWGCAIAATAVVAAEALVRYCAKDSEPAPSSTGRSRQWEGAYDDDAYDDDAYGDDAYGGDAPTTSRNNHGVSQLTYRLSNNTRLHGHSRLTAAYSNPIRREAIVPTLEQVMKDPVSVPEAVVDRAYTGIAEYLETMFQLFREDFLRSIRSAVPALRSGNKEEMSRAGWRLFKVYVDGGVVHELNPTADTRELLKHDQWVLLSRDNFQRDIVACLIFRGRGQSRDTFKLKPVVKGKLEEMVEYTLAEQSSSYFMAYKGVLEQYQEFAKSAAVPMFKYVVELQRSVSAPATVARSRGLIQMGGQEFFLRSSDNIPRHSLPGYPIPLDENQIAVVHDAMQREVALIQGPPGTGKTFVGVHIAAMICENRARLGIKTPILVVCFKNFAVDEFLKKLHEKLLVLVQEGLLKHDGPLVKRAGGACNDEYILENDLLLGGASVTEMQRTLVIGATTTGAATSSKIRKCCSQVVIVEEAGEVLEQHVVASLTNKLEHLIMIGDHQQLRPAPACHDLANTPYNLDVSLFERLIKNGHPFTQLTTQRRMHPIMTRAIIRPHFYPAIRDGPETESYPEPAGIRGRLVFVNLAAQQSRPKSGCSYMNEGEAQFVVELAGYILKQHQYKSSQITVLSTYAAQSQRVKQLLDSRSMKDVRVVNVDNYQGQENDIIILTLVRSFHGQSIGFLGVANRICVALSRARHAFYMVGNLGFLSKNGDLWSAIGRTLRQNGVVHRGLPVICAQHETKQLIASHKEFRTKTPDGGCSRSCEFVYACGHACPMKCHAIWGNCHTMRGCERPSFYTCEHKKKTQSGQPGNGKKKKKRNPAANQDDRKCGEFESLCTQRCTNGCQHRKCTKLCYEPCNVDVCLERCPKKLKCGHDCLGLCSQRCPGICATCSPKEKLVKRMTTENDRLVMVDSCDHVFLWKQLEAHILNESQTQYPSCPTCKTPLVSDQLGSLLRSARLELEEKKAEFVVSKSDDMQQLMEYTHNWMGDWKMQLDNWTRPIREPKNTDIAQCTRLIEEQMSGVEQRALQPLSSHQPRDVFRAYVLLDLFSTSVYLLASVDMSLFEEASTKKKFIVLWEAIVREFAQLARQTDTRPVGGFLPQIRAKLGHLCVFALISGPWPVVRRGPAGEAAKQKIRSFSQTVLSRIERAQKNANSAGTIWGVVCEVESDVADMVDEIAASADERQQQYDPDAIREANNNIVDGYSDVFYTVLESDDE